MGKTDGSAWWDGADRVKMRRSDLLQEGEMGDAKPAAWRRREGRGSAGTSQANPSPGAGTPHPPGSAWSRWEVSVGMGSGWERWHQAVIWWPRPRSWLGTLGSNASPRKPRVPGWVEARGPACTQQPLKWESCNAFLSAVAWSRPNCNVTKASAESLGLSAHRHRERNAGLADSCCSAEFGERGLLLVHSNLWQLPVQSLRVGFLGIPLDHLFDLDHLALGYGWRCRWHSEAAVGTGSLKYACTAWSGSLTARFAGVAPPIPLGFLLL